MAVQIRCINLEKSYSSCKVKNQPGREVVRVYFFMKSSSWKSTNLLEAIWIQLQVSYHELEQELVRKSLLRLKRTILYVYMYIYTYVYVLFICIWFSDKKMHLLFFTNIFFNFIYVYVCFEICIYYVLSVNLHMPIWYHMCVHTHVHCKSSITVPCWCLNLKSAHQMFAALLCQEKSKSFCENPNSRFPGNSSKLCTKQKAKRKPKSKTPKQKLWQKSNRCFYSLVHMQRMRMPHCSLIVRVTHTHTHAHPYMQESKCRGECVVGWRAWKRLLLFSFISVHAFPHCNE